MITSTKVLTRHDATRELCRLLMKKSGKGPDEMMPIADNILTGYYMGGDIFRWHKEMEVDEYTNKFLKPMVDGFVWEE